MFCYFLWLKTHHCLGNYIPPDCVWKSWKCLLPFLFVESIFVQSFFQSILTFTKNFRFSPYSKVKSICLSGFVFLVNGIECLTRGTRRWSTSVSLTHVPFSDLSGLGTGYHPIYTSSIDLRWRTVRFCDRWRRLGRRYPLFPEVSDPLLSFVKMVFLTTSFSSFWRTQFLVRGHVSSLYNSEHLLVFW